MLTCRQSHPTTAQLEQQSSHPVHTARKITLQQFRHIHDSKYLCRQHLVRLSQRCTCQVPLAATLSANSSSHCGDAEILLRHLDDAKDIILATTGMGLQPRKSVFLLAGERGWMRTVFAEAERMGVQVRVHGGVVMGIPVGTDVFIKGQQLADAMHRLMLRIFIMSVRHASV